MVELDGKKGKHQMEWRDEFNLGDGRTKASVHSGTYTCMACDLDEAAIVKSTVTKPHAM
jgi:hypothetical protein